MNYVNWKAYIFLIYLLIIVIFSLILVTTRSSAFATEDSSTPPTTNNYDPITTAVRSIGLVKNREAVIPSQCYTKTEGISNPCWTCHVSTKAGSINAMNDWELQKEYAFSDVGLTNHWENLFVDRSKAIGKISDKKMLAYIRTDNYTPLKEALNQIADYPGYIPDLDFKRGFDEEGFARDGSGWRAIRYKPFLGTFWPTNGSTDDVMIRLPETFQKDSRGQYSREIYKLNLAILEAAIAVDPEAEFSRETEPVSEVLAKVDLNGDGKQESRVTTITQLPSHYVGAANHIQVQRYLYPQYTEFLHTVRYIDPDNPQLLSTRTKEVRYMRRILGADTWSTLRSYEHEHNEKEEGNLPIFAGTPLTGLRNRHGWQLQGFIENSQGQLRLQTEEEHLFCMGCHSNLGVTVDQTFALARKVPGKAGWQHHYLAGIPDVPQYGQDKPETLAYFERVGGGDEFRANQEVLDRFFPSGQLNTEEVLRAAPNGDKDLSYLITPSPKRAYELNKAYMALVREQSFELGRDTVLLPTKNVHEQIENGSTDLNESGQIYADGRLWLSW